MSTASRPLSTLPSAPWPSVTLPITVTFPGTVFPGMSTTGSVVTTTGTSITFSPTISTTTTSTGAESPSNSGMSTSSNDPTSTSPSTRFSSSTSTLQSSSSTLTRTVSSPTPSPTVASSSSTLIGTLAPSDDSSISGGANGPTVAAAEQEISRLKETRNIVIAVLSALALIAVLVAARAVYLRRRAREPPPAPLPQHQHKFSYASGPLLTADTPMGGTTHGAPWPFLAVPEWQPPQLNRLAPPPPRPPQPQPYTNVHMAHVHDHPHRASILPQTLDAWIAGAGSSSIDLRSQPTPSPHVRHEYKHGYI